MDGRFLLYKGYSFIQKKTPKLRLGFALLRYQEKFHMNIQLSISLLASDKPAALERCLDSLIPILMKVPSELIVVLTGTDENVYRTADLYTDQLVHYTWNNDFSAARNQGLNIARGEWFLYIDDDEWFEDTTEICNFFLSGEYQTYGMAFYKQRDYADWGGVAYCDFPVLRMFQITPEIHFENPIHEEPQPRFGACKYLDTYVHHYGYIENDGKSYTKKTTRNIPLLLQDAKIRPFYVKNYVQLSNEYQTKKEWHLAEKYCREGLRYCKKKEDAPYLRLLQADLIDILYEKNSYKSSEQEILAILQHEKPCEMVRLTAYLALNKIYKNQNLPKEALRYGLAFEKTLAYMDRKPELWHQQQCAHLSERRIKQPANLHQIRINCVEDALKLADIQTAEYFFSLLPWVDEYQMQSFYPPFDFLKEQYGDLFYELIKGFSMPSPYLSLQKALGKDTENAEQRRELFTQCVKETSSSYLQRQAIKGALLSGIDISEFVTVLELDGWKQCTVDIVDSLSEPELLKVQKAACLLHEKLPVYAVLLGKRLYERKLSHGYLTGQKLLDTLTEYVKCVLTYYKGKYKDELFEEGNRTLLPKDCRFAILMSEALLEIKSARLSAAVRLFREALVLNAAMTGTIHELIRQMEGHRGAFSIKPNEEFQELSVKMKAALKTMAEKQQYTEAASIIDQLSQVIPDDLELLRIRQEILRKSSE